MSKCGTGLSWCLATTVLLAAFGCSDSHSARTGRDHVGSLACGSEACGGDIVGSWEIAGACVERTDEMLSEECEGADATIRDLSLDGTFTFDEDGTAMRQVETEVEVRLHLPNDCLMGATCEQLEAALSDSEEDTGTPFSCSSGGGGCNCDGSVAGTDTGTFDWAKSGNQLMTSSDELPWAYCVQEDGAMIRREGEGFEFSMLLERR